MNCNDCKVPMVDGQVMAPVWGTTDGRMIIRGTTLNKVSSTLAPCFKCPKCGHSVSKDGLLTTDDFNFH